MKRIFLTTSNWYRKTAQRLALTILINLVKTKESLSLTELDEKIKTILSQLNKNKGKLVLLEFDEKRKNTLILSLLNKKLTIYIKMK